MAVFNGIKGFRKSLTKFQVRYNLLFFGNFLLGFFCWVTHLHEMCCKSNLAEKKNVLIEYKIINFNWISLLSSGLSIRWVFVITFLHVDDKNQQISYVHKVNHCDLISIWSYCINWTIAVIAITFSSTHFKWTVGAY